MTCFGEAVTEVQEVFFLDGKWERGAGFRGAAAAAVLEDGEVRHKGTIYVLDHCMISAVNTVPPLLRPLTLSRSRVHDSSLPLSRLFRYCFESARPPSGASFLFLIG